MSRATTTFAVLLVASTMTIGLAGCKDSAPKAQPSTTQATQAPADPATDPATAPPSDPANTPAPNPATDSAACDDEQYVTGLIADLQQNKQPDDLKAAAQRLQKFMLEAPPEINRAAQGVFGPTVLAMQHPETTGALSSDDVKKDVAELDAWHTKNC